jgi:hypothetical protein
MSSIGAVGGVGGAGGAHAGGVSSMAGSQAVTPAKGASGVSDDGGKNSMVIGDGSIVGNTQTQTINNIEINNFESIGSKDFCALHNMTNGKEASALEGIGEMSAEDMQKLLMIMILMKILESLLEGSDSGQQTAGTMMEAVMSAGGSEGASSAEGSSAGGGDSSGGSRGGSSGGAASGA